MISIAPAFVEEGIAMVDTLVVAHVVANHLVTSS